MSRYPQPSGNDDLSNRQTYCCAPSQLLLSGGITVEVYHWSRLSMETSKYPVSVEKETLSTMSYWGVLEFSGIFESYSRIKVLVKRKKTWRHLLSVSFLGQNSNENSDTINRENI